MLEKEFLKLKIESSIPELSIEADFKNTLKQASCKERVVYAKAPFAGPERVLEYLGNYTHRIAISNYRIEAIEDGCVIFRYKDRSDGNKSKLMRLPAHEFIHRFLSHVLPQKFVRIRHFGFLGSRQKKKNIETARIGLGSPKNVAVVKDEDFEKVLQRLVSVDVTKCPCCKTGTLTEVAEILPHRNLMRTRKDTS